jgi:antirestriction protein ArdC
LPRIVLRIVSRTSRFVAVYRHEVCPFGGTAHALRNYMKTTKSAAVRDEKISGAIKAIDDGVAAFKDGAEWGKWLSMQSRFHRYSFGNTMLIMLHCPIASRVAGYRAWEKLGRNVRKGEKGIPIFAPAGMGRATRKNERTGDEETVRSWLRFKIVYVFDASQTEGDDLPTITRPIQETPFASNIETLRRVALELPGVVSMINVRAREPGEHATAGGWYERSTKAIVVVDEGTEAAKFRVLVHEVAHAILHGQDDHHGRPEREVEAESVAYVVCDALGLDTSGSSFGYVASWAQQAGKDAIKSSADRIARAAKTILDALDVTGEDEGVEE